MEPLPLACLPAVSDSWFGERASEASGISFIKNKKNNFIICRIRVLNAIKSCKQQQLEETYAHWACTFSWKCNWYLKISWDPTFVIPDYEGLDVSLWLPCAMRSIIASPFHLIFESNPNIEVKNTKKKVFPCSIFFASRRSTAKILSCICEIWRRWRFEKSFEERDSSCVQCY